MKSDFSKPQRQSLVGVLVMFADTLQKIIRGSWPFLIVWIFKIDDINKLYLVLVTGGIVILTSIIAYLKYLNFTFFLDEDNEEFVIRSGILNKSRTAIPLNKIQQVNINQSLIQKIIGVHSLEVDTAGSSKKEVEIKAIPHTIATLLKEKLLEGGSDVSVTGSLTDEQPQHGKPFIHISLLSLFKTGITSNYVRSFALILAFAITIFQNIEDYFRVTGSEEHILDDVSGDLILSFISFIIIGIMVLTIIVNLIRTIIKYFNFKITKQQNGLLLSYGLLNTRNAIIKPERVQMLVVGRNYFQKKMDIQDIKVKQASDSNIADKEARKLAIEIPGCSESEKYTLMQFLLDKIPQRGEQINPNIRRVAAKVIGLLLIPVSVYFILAYTVLPKLYEYMYLILPYVVFTLLIILFGHRNYKLYVNSEFIIKQSGAWDIDNEFLAPHKIQSIKVTQYFWQRISDIGKVTLYTAGGNLSYGVADYSKIKQLVNYWLYQVETTDKDWM